MSSELFLLAFVTGAALLSAWIDQRLPSLIPSGFQRIIVHAIAALVVLRLVAVGESLASAWVLLFGVLLPALVYAFLVGIWTIRTCQGAMAASR